MNPDIGVSGHLSPVNPDVLELASDDYGRAFLESIIGFMRPFAPTHSSINSVADDYLPRASDRAPTDAATTRACGSSEGENLLKALGNFMGLVFRIQGTVSEGPSQVNQQKSAVETEEENHAQHDLLDKQSASMSNVNMTPSFLSIHKQITNQEIPSQIMEAIYGHVFNNMPIRVIVFDPAGIQLEMLERKGIVRHILSRIVNTYDGGSIAEGWPELLREYSKYAILSHTWIRGNPGDVVYQDWGSRELPENSRGYAKIANFCKVAANDYGVRFGWMDTVCINKDSSTELDESIRSMYKWYQLANICVTYLSETSEIEQMHLDSWFTRGWTLQELLAPRTIQFYNREWKPIAPKSDLVDVRFDTAINDISTASLPVSEILEQKVDDWLPFELQYQIFKATTITRSELAMFQFNLDSLPLSRIMQLAATRKVTREEDMIYSLMGLLAVGMPVAYGEGSQAAFTRLLREIMAVKYNCRDVFNHRSGHSLLPTTITGYLHRYTAFNRTLDGLPTALDTPSPKEPIILTHLGVRVQLLFIPVFQKETYESIIPPYLVSQTICFAGESSSNYFLLKSIYASTSIISNDIRAAPTSPWNGRELVYLAILNFSEESNGIVLPHQCLYIAMGPNIREVCRITAVNVSESEPISSPLILSLERSIPTGNIPRKELAQRLGMQVATIYMR